jgi:hypothetical protein
MILKPPEKEGSLRMTTATWLVFLISTWAVGEARKACTPVTESNGNHTATLWLP